MNFIKNILKTGSLCLLFVFAACSSDDNGDNGDDDGGQPGANHTYEIQLTNGAETIELSGSLPNDTPPMAIYVEPDQTEFDVPAVTLLINDGSVSIVGGLLLNSNQQPLPLSYEGYAQGTASVLNITKDNTSVPLVSTSGTATFSNFELYGHGSTPESLASFTLNFDASFIDMQNETTYQGTGTIVVQPIEF